MARLNSHQLQTQLAANYQLIKGGQPGLALGKLQKLYKKVPQSPDVSHLLALAYKAVNDVNSAKKYFLRSLKLNAQQPEVHNNLANLYKADSQLTRAEKHYRHALEMNESYSDARRNLALCLASQKQYAEALNLFEELISRKHDDLTALVGLADSLRDLARFDEAKSRYQQVLTLNPQHVNALHNLGLTHHLNGELSEAKQFYEQAYRLADDDPRILQSYATALAETKSVDQAIELLQAYLSRCPQHTFLHARLNELLWESGRLQEFGTSFERAIVVEPNSEDLHSNFVSQLFRAGQLERAKQVLDQALPRFKSSNDLMALKGQIEADLKNYDLSKQAFLKSLSLKFTKEAAQPLVKLSILHEDYSSAQETLDRLMDDDHDCQMNWALQSLVWRLQKDSRYQWLCDYDTQVKPYTLGCPPGYASLEDFLDKLQAVLLAKHIHDNQPLEQTLRNGSQTAARLFHGPEAELKLLKEQLNVLIQRYIEELPKDDSHPLYRRKSSSFKFSGSWSVKLRPSGFHVNHVHPDGWISSSFYVGIPSSIHEEDDQFSGCIKFGESPLGLGENEVVERVLRPKPGMVVLFPSYMWHGTVPFSGATDEFRLTAPFDVQPIREVTDV